MHGHFTAIATNIIASWMLFHSSWTVIA